MVTRTVRVDDNIYKALKQIQKHLKETTGKEWKLSEVARHYLAIKENGGHILVFSKGKRYKINLPTLELL